MKVVRVLIADDHERFRMDLAETLEREPDIHVVATESNGADAVRRVRALDTDDLDLVLMDIDMPIMNGIEATREIAALYPELPIVILTVSTLDSDLFAAIDCGAVGFLNKNLSPASLTRTLRDFWSNGSLPMSRVQAGKVIHRFQQRVLDAALVRPNIVDQLSWREQEILARIAAGARDREIAAALFVAETTIKTHVRHILLKLGARNRAEAAARMRMRTPDAHPEH
jgi:DNA-binding NarL/FixJ family response regulator